MPNPYFHFKQFIIHQDACSMKVTTDACLFGAWVAATIQNDDSVQHILDIGSGTGLLSVMLAQQSRATIDAVELQEKDYHQSVENIKASPWQKRLHIFNADALTFGYDKKYDVIISNPPFYESDLKSPSLHKNIAHHNAGLNLESLLKIITLQLSANGRFYLLLPAKRKEEVFKLCNIENFYINQVVDVHQTDKHPAFRIMIEGSAKATAMVNSAIIIKANGSYSNEFIALLKDYYLHL